MSKLVTIYGGSGFVGRYIARRMAKEGWRVRVAVRRPNEAMFVKPYGVVGPGRAGVLQHPRRCFSRAGDAGADAVVNCVGILAERGKNTVRRVQAEGAARIARIAAEEGVPRMVQISAIGADADSDSDYAAPRRGRGGGAGAYARRRDPAPLDRLRARGPVLQPLRQMARLGPCCPSSGPNAVPAGLCRRCRRRRRSRA
jgi:nucleoside-diphosphate-sugar epimerase